MTRLAGWGRYPVVDSEVTHPRSVADAGALAATADNYIARGNGRSYGDAAVGTVRTMVMTKLDRMMAFDPDRATVRVEAGMLLSDLIAALLPRGYFPAVVPGTRFVTIGGAIAADVHGKNHHGEGGFGHHVECLTLATPGAGVLSLSATENPELFHATIGGMGMTGVILDATLRLKRVESGWIRQTTHLAENLSAAIRALDAADSSTYSVAWIDCLARGAALGRSLIYLGEHASRMDVANAGQAQSHPLPSAKQLAIPFDLPSMVLNRLSMSAFNTLYYQNGARHAGTSRLVPLDPYFFPLDRLSNWNRIYGRRGFVQHQCLIPAPVADAVLSSMLERISARGDASFLAVLKKLGAGSGLMSFPSAGYTLTLDFPVSRGLLAFLDELDELVRSAGGRLYLAKDARQSRETFAAGYPQLDKFRAIRRSVDPKGQIASHLSARLGI